MAIKPETDAFVQLAQQNREFACQLASRHETALRWVPIIAFDSVTQLIQALVWERYSVRITNHPQRLREIESNPDLVEISGHYRRLYDLSQRAHFSPAFRFTAELAQDLLEVDLAAIEKHVLNLLDAK